MTERNDAKQLLKRYVVTRCLVLIASVLIQICLGGLYAWSVFVPSLRSEYGLSTAMTQIVFGVTLAVFTTTMVFAGRMQEKRGPRSALLIGGLLFGAGYLVAAMSAGSFPVLLIGIGVVGGVGIGFCYVCPLATCIKWFPESRGTITGLAVAGFGGGAIFLSSFAGVLLERGCSVLEIFRIIGLVYGGLILLLALFMRVPGSQECRERQCDTDVRRLLGTSSFWYLAVGMFCGTFAGLMVIGNMGQMAATAGLSSKAAGIGLGALAVGNAAGRIGWGFVVDRIGRKAIPLSLLVSCGSTALLIPSGSREVVFAAIAAVVGFGFGACFVVYAAQVAERYGPGAVGSIYPMIFLFYGFSGIAGPFAGGALYDLTGSYTTSVIVAVSIAAIGLVATAVLARRTGAERAVAGLDSLVDDQLPEPLAWR
jgi:MFS transporter, OFA family, oxalate/formate antiporter